MTGKEDQDVRYWPTEKALAALGNRRPARLEKEQTMNAAEELAAAQAALAAAEARIAAEAARDDRTLDMMRSPYRWPHLVLPLKSDDSYGTLVETRGGFGFAPVQMIEEVLMDDPCVRLGGDELLVELVDEGWTVD